MTKQEFDEMAALVVRLRKDVELHTDALKQSNAQCGEYLLHNEMLAADRATLHKELVEVRAALASATKQRDSYKQTLDEWERADTKPHARIDEVAAAVPVCMQCLKQRIETAHDYETRPSVAILTKPLLLEDVADHVVLPVLSVGEPDPANDPKDAGLEFRNVVPTPEMIKHVDYWDLVSGAAAIAFTTINPGLVFWRIAGSREWRTDPCPQPLKPHGMTWQQLDKVMADKKAAESIAAPMPAAEAPMCRTCHECGGVLRPSRAAGSHSVLCCRTERCSRINTAWQDDVSPYHGPCKSAAPVRHE
jgi:cytochrome c553